MTRRTTAPRRITDPRRALSWILAVMSLVIALLGPLPARAQQGLDDAARFLERTDEMLERIGAQVRESESEQARRVFQDALARQQRARQLLDQGRPLFAVRLSRAAREAALQAERLARAGLSFEQRARRYVERLRDLHDEVSERAHDADNRQALRFVRQAEQLMTRARNQYQQTHYREAFRLLQAAEQQLRRAARLLFEQGGADRLQRDLDRTADLIAAAREALGDSDDPALRDLLERAARDLQRARDALADGDQMRCLRFARLAREQARQVLRQAGGRPDAAAVQAQIDRFDQRQTDLAAAAADAGNRQALDQLNDARRLRDRAAASLADGRPREALRRIRAALNLQNRVRDLLR